MHCRLQRNNTTLNLMFIVRDAVYDSFLVHAAACTTQGRVDFAATNGHVRRSLEHNRALRLAFALELTLEYCWQHVYGFGVKDDSDNDDEDPTYVYSTDEDSTDGSDSSAEYEEEPAPDAHANSLPEEGVQTGVQTSPVRCAHVPIRRRADKRTELGVAAFDILRYMLREAADEQKQPTAALLLHFVNFDHAEAMQESWELPVNLPSWRLMQWAMRMSGPLDLRKGADNYSRLDYTQRMLFETSPLHQQAVIVKHSKAKGMTKNLANDLYLETFQADLHQDARKKGSDDVLVSYQDTTVNMEQRLDEKRSLERKRLYRCIHGTVPPREVEPVLAAASRCWIRKHNFVGADQTGDRRVKDDRGMPIDGLKGFISGEDITSNLLTFRSDGAAMMLAEVKRQVWGKATSCPRLETFKATTKTRQQSDSFFERRKELSTVEEICARTEPTEGRATGRSHKYTAPELGDLVAAWIDKDLCSLERNETGRQPGSIKSSLRKSTLAGIVARTREIWHENLEHHQLLKNIESELDQSTMGFSSTMGGGVLLTTELSEAADRLERQLEQAKVMPNVRDLAELCERRVEHDHACMHPSIHRFIHPSIH